MQVRFDIAFVHRFSVGTGRPVLVSLQASETVEDHHVDAALHWVERRLQQIGENSPRDVIELDEEAVAGMGCVLTWPLMSIDGVMGAVTLFSRPKRVFTDKVIDALHIPVEMAGTVVENTVMAERMITMEGINRSIRAIVQDPSPQNIVNVLRDYVFPPHVTSCLILLYGPEPQEGPATEFDYVEIKGVWLHQPNPNLEVGQRYALQDYETFIERMNSGEPMVMDIDDYRSVIGELGEGFVNAETQSVVFLPLHSKERKLGIIGITANRPYEFDRQSELGSFQIISEFLTMSTMTEAIHREVSLVKEGRAALLDSVQDGVVMIRPNDEDHVLTINERFARMFQVNAKQVHGVTLRELLETMLIPEKVRQDLWQEWQKTSASDRDEISGEFQIRDAMAKEMEIEWYSRPVRQDDRIMGRIFTFQDVTAERANQRARQLMLSRISHELRTPLTSIHGFAQFIIEQVGDELPPLAHDYLNIILGSTDQLKRIFTDLIQLTRANAGELELQLQETSLPDVVIQAVAQMEVLMSEKSQKVIMDLDDDLPMMMLDMNRISQVLSNLLNNASKYAPPNTEIRVSAQRVTARRALPRSAPPDVLLPCALVSVIDQGEGIKRQDIEEVFTPFFRTDVAKRAKVEGSGLGLSIARSIVELHRGRIWAEPPTKRKPGGRFFFTLPLESTT
jgi:signal transduction histidine kinase